METVILAIETYGERQSLYRLSDGRVFIGERWDVGLQAGDEVRVEEKNGAGLRLCYGPHFFSSFEVRGV